MLNSKGVKGGASYISATLHIKTTLYVEKQISGIILSIHYYTQIVNVTNYQCGSAQTEVETMLLNENV